MRNRREQVGAFFAAQHETLEHTVDRAVFATPTVLEDACQYAWCQLVRRDDITLDRHGFWWLYGVAVHEVWLLTGKQRNEQPIDALGPETIPADVFTSLDDVPLTVERRELIRLIDGLPERQRRLIILRATGFSYAEIARMTGDTTRTVERQLRRARENLHRARAALR